MRGRRPFEGAKNEKTPDSNLMICRAGEECRAVFMWNIAGTYAVCQEKTSGLGGCSAVSKIVEPLAIVSPARG